MGRVEEYLEKLITSLDFLFKQLENSGLNKTLEKMPVGLFDLNFQFNVRVKNGKIKDEYTVFITREASKLMKGYSASVGFTIRGTEETWLEVFQGEKSLMAEVIEGHLKVSNMRINWLKITLLSNLLSNLISMKLLKLK